MTSLVAASSRAVMTTSAMSATKHLARRALHPRPDDGGSTIGPAGDLGLARPLALLALLRVEGRAVEGEAGIPAEVGALARRRASTRSAAVRR